MATSDSSSERPLRDHMSDPDITWRNGLRPDYSLVDEKYLAEKTMSHAAGSREKFVENFVKTWEMETLHKAKVEEWQTIDQGNFTIQVNFGRKYSGSQMQEAGSYAMLMWDSPLYDVSMETEQSAETLFRTVFKNGFAWELLELLSGPPVVTFTWRHWGKWEGPYNDTPPSGENIELFGCCVVRLTDQMKISSINVLYDPNPMMATLMNFTRPGGCPYSQKLQQPTDLPPKQSQREKNTACPFSFFRR